MKLLFVTGNLFKLAEARKILSDWEIENISIVVPELQGSRETIVREKAKFACRKLGKTVIVEDTSLCFTALHNLPGPYIKDFLEQLGLNGLNKILAGYKDKRAKAVTSIGLCAPGKEPVVIEGITHGKIVKPKGRKKFSWDPIFKPNGSKLTYAQMTMDEKNKISHRKKAFVKLRDHLLKKGFK